MSLGINDWWAIQDTATGFVYPCTLAVTRQCAKERFLAIWDAPRYDNWRRWREGRNGSKHRAVRVRVEVYEFDNAK